MGGDGEGKAAKEHKSKRRSRSRERKHKHKSSKKHRRHSRSDSSDSDAPAVLPVETAAEELARLRKASDLLRDVLRAFPAVRKDLRLLLWNLDAGQGVDLRNLGGASTERLVLRSLCPSCLTRTVCCVADATLRDSLERLFYACRLVRSPAGLFVSLPGAPPVLRSLGSVFDEDLSAAPPRPAAVEPPRRVLGPQAPPWVEHMYTGPAPEGLDAALDGSDGEQDDRARARARSTAVERAVNAVRASEATPAHEDDGDGEHVMPVALPIIGPAAMPPQADVGKRVLGPMMVPREVLEAAAEETAFAVGPPPPELVAEADVATPETRDQAVNRVLRLAADTQGAGDAYALLGVEEHATAGEVRKAFWRASLLTHPDKCDHPRAADAFAAITKAKDILADASQRRALDDKRQEARLRAEFQAELEGKIQAAKWRQLRGMAPLAEDAELLRLASGEADDTDRREAWMTELPQERQARPGADTVQRSVTAFRQDERAERDVSWAETPQQKAARERHHYIQGPKVGALTHGDVEAHGPRAGVPEVREKSLLEKHQEAQLRKHKAAGPAAAPAKGALTAPFDRDRDLAAPRKPVDLAKLQQQQGTLSSRFGTTQQRGGHT